MGPAKLAPIIAAANRLNRNMEKLAQISSHRVPLALSPMKFNMYNRVVLNATEANRQYES